MKENNNYNLRISDEINFLIPKNSEKKNLLDVFERLSKKLEDSENENIADAYIDKNDSDNEKNIEVKKNINKIVLLFMSLIILPSFSIIYLVGILMIISLKDVLFNLLLASIKCKIDLYCNIDDLKKYSNFYEAFLKEALKEPNDFQIIMFWNIIGLQCLDSFGFKISVVILTPFYLLIMYFIYIFDFLKYDSDTYNYSYLRLTSLFFLWLGSSIILGSGTINAHNTLVKYYPIFIDNFCSKDKINEEDDENKNIIIREMQEPLFPNAQIEKENNEKNEEDKENEETEENKEDEEDKEAEENKIIEINGHQISKDQIENDNNEDDFNYFLHNLKKEIKKENDRTDIIKEEKINNIKTMYYNELIKIRNKIKNKKSKKRTYNSFWFISINIMSGYLFKYLILIPISNLKRKNDEKYIHPINETEADYKVNQINFTSIYFLLGEKIDNETIFKEKYNYNKNLFLLLCLIYLISVLLSLILFWMFQKCILNKKIEEKKEKEKKDCCDKICIWQFFYEFLNCICYIEKIGVKNKKPKVGCCKLCCETCNNYCELIFCNNNLVNCGNGKKERHCCCAACRYNENDYNKDYQFFCFCYQDKGICYWINKFITNEAQKDIIPCMFLYLIARLITIKTDKLYNKTIENNLDRNNYFDSLLLAFNLFIFIISIFSYAIRKNCCKILAKLNCLFKFIKSKNEIIIIIISVLIYDAYTSLYYLQRYSLDFFRNEKEKESELFISVIFNKLFIFSINYYCIDIYNKNKGNEIIFSQSILISIYLFIIDEIIDVINKIVKNEDVLSDIQLLFSWIIGYVFPWFYFTNFILGVSKCFCFCIEGNCYCNCCCCNKDSICCRCCYSQCCDHRCSYCRCCNICYFLCCNNCC